MKAVYSYWSKPAGISGNSYGSVKHFYASLVSSALSSRQFFDSVVIYVNEKHIPVFESLGVFDEVLPAFEEMDDLHPFHWAVAKLDVYRRQTKPFWHIDNDVHITKPEIRKFFSAPLVAQSHESEQDFGYNYNPQTERFHAYHEMPPDYIRDWKDRHLVEKYYFSSNAGVLGGTDVEFITWYAETAYQYMLKHGKDLPDINTTIEQLYFTQLCFLHGKKITYLLENWSDVNCAKAIGYYHFWGGTKKSKNPKTGRVRIEEMYDALPHEYRLRIAKAINYV